MQLYLPINFIHSQVNYRIGKILHIVGGRYLQNVPALAIFWGVWLGGTPAVKEAGIAGTPYRSLMQLTYSKDNLESKDGFPRLVQAGIASCEGSLLLSIINQ